MTIVKFCMQRSVAADRSFLDQADVILLAGGDIKRGWDVFAEVGLREAIAERYAEGAVLIGVSAGAVQLGLLGWREAESSPQDLFETFKLVPFIIGVHQEKEEWADLKAVVRGLGEYVTGIGIPSGGWLIYYADGTLEPIRQPLSEFSIREGAMTHHLLFPVQEERGKGFE